MHNTVWLEVVRSKRKESQTNISEDKSFTSSLLQAKSESSSTEKKNKKFK